MSELLVDNLTGKTSAGDITVYGEGGTATQSLQQGLAKAWLSYDQRVSVGVNDSLNISSVSDSGTGHNQPSFSSAMGNSNYYISGSSSYDGNVSDANVTGADEVAPSTSSIYTHGTRATNGSLYDCEYVFSSIKGDLA